MLYSQQIKPINYFKDNSAKVIAEIKQTREPLIITQNGEATCVVQDIYSWEQTQQTIALLKILDKSSSSFMRFPSTVASDAGNSRIKT